LRHVAGLDVGGAAGRSDVSRDVFERLATPANASAAASPMPLPAPVIQAIRPVS
jgi:hypothetical protein